MIPIQAVSLLRRLCTCALLVVPLSFSAHAATEQDLKWDLSYRGARAAYPMDPKEFMQVWPGPEQRRPIFAKLAAYAGAPIEASLLIETMDGHAGDPSATWIVKTRDGASACSFHPKSLDRPCQSLDPAATDAAIRAIMAMPALPPLADTPARRPERERDEPRLNYLGFLSLYIDGKALQRPINLIETTPPGTPLPGIAAQDVARLTRALSRLTLTPEAFAQQERQLGEQQRATALAAHVEGGALEQVRSMLDDRTHRARVDGLLARAVATRRRPMVELLLARGANLNEHDGAPLKAAVDAHDLGMVAWLIERGARVDPVAGPGGAQPYQSALSLAAQHGHADTARLLIRHGARVDLAQSLTPLDVAARRLDLPMVELLLSAGAPVDQVAGSEDGTALMKLARAFEAPSQASDPALEHMMRRLLKAGADIDFLGVGCRTALSHAAEFDRNGAMEALLKRLGADPQASTRCQQRLQRGLGNDSDSAEAQARAAVSGPAGAYLKAGDFTRFETLYRSLLDARERTPSGVWKLALLYAQLREHVHGARDLDRLPALLEAGARWQRKHPASTPARLLQVHARLWHARTVREQARNGQMTLAQRQAMLASRGAARTLLAAAKPLAAAARDPEWYRAALYALNEDETLSAAAVHTLLDEARTRYPNYHENYFQAAYLTHDPRRRGLDSAHAIGREAGLRGDPEQPSLYARVLWADSAFAGRAPQFGPGQADWRLAKASFEALVGSYPDPRNLNAFAYFACLAGDHATSGALIEQIGDDLLLSLWGRPGWESRNRFERCRIEAAALRSATSLAAARALAG